MQHPTPQRILVIGAGFAGMWSALAAARRIALEASPNRPVEVALIAPQPVLTIRPRLYEAAPAGMAVSLRDLFDATGVRFIPGSVRAIRTDTDEVDLIDGNGHSSTVHYDRLVLAAGSSLFRPDIPGLREHAFSVDEGNDAADLETHLHALTNEPSSMARNTVIVAGGGFTGLEIATELPTRLRVILGESATIRVIIVERADTIGPDLGPGPRPEILQALADLGIECHLGSAVASIDAGGLTTVNGERIEGATVIWTAGVRASELTQQIPAERDASGRLRVDHDLRIPTARKVFVAGDAAVAPTDNQGNHTLMSCQHAIPSGKSAGDNAAADLLALATTPYSQPDYVTCLDLGGYGAVVTKGWDRKIWLTGAEAKQMKVMINSKLIYPPVGREAAFAAANPAQALAL
ncbi:NADH dehydrogenase [Rhodoferax ferrireducens]|uniref:NADH dehydrogenase n=1 Tax=Rhodoferax ferrireducens TaxID=192843 RepID=A0ABU2C270_9BURK|nr:FAD-dependent oxidoreductase [Rhodoferax ferrireducens]MDR7375428.1 NADH dehydrogenase [Rhodoferax ferrireducens]